MTDERLKAYLEGAETAYSVADAEQEQMQTELTKLRTELASQAAKIEAVRAIAKNMRHYQSCASIYFETLKQPCDCNVGLLKDALAALES